MRGVNLHEFSVNRVGSLFFVHFVSRGGGSGCQMSLSRKVSKQVSCIVAYGSSLTSPSVDRSEFLR